MSRLTRSFFLLFTLLVCHGGVAQTVAVDAESIVEYVEACRKDNGAFGPRDQPYTDAAWNYPAVRTLLLLGKKVTNPQAILKHGLDYPSGHVGYGHWHFFHQHAIRSALGKPMIVDYTSVRLVHQGFEVRYYGSPFGFDGDTFFKAAGGSEPDPRDSAASELGYYNLSSLYYTLAGMLASGRKAKNPHELSQFITTRQSPSGGFVDVRTKDGQPINEHAHVAHTWHALASLQILGEPYPHADRCSAFLRSCQLPSGGFRWSPKDDAPGNYADVYYT
ncbi:MAG: prenyltransferase/squalene oxidase repeat-containing protein, partial [Pirellulaceae bacterium]|nr:prenyltransferase/squalene oxidase repeat-containing protein [Pirellulaceae bacterium]